MFKESTNFLGRKRTSEPLHVVFHENLHRRALDRAGALDRDVRPTRNRHVGAKQNLLCHFEARKSNLSCNGFVIPSRADGGDLTTFERANKPREVLRCAQDDGASKKTVRSSENLRVPIRLFQAAFSFVFEKFVEWVEEYSRPTGVDANVEIDFVVEKMSVALSHHPEKAG